MRGGISTVPRRCPSAPWNAAFSRGLDDPGAFLKLGADQLDLVPSQWLAFYAVLNGTAAVTADMTLRFSRPTGGAPEHYLFMQTGHDLEAAQLRLKDELAKIEPAA